MIVLADRVEEYLALRRALGFKLDRHGRLLVDFVRFCAQRGEGHVTIDTAAAWAGLPAEASPVWIAQRLGVVRVFARWLHAVDPANQVPPSGMWAAPYRRPSPYLYSPAEISALLTAARAEPHPLRAATFEAFIGLLAVTGIRGSEAMGLDREDLDVERRLLVVRNTKFGKTRLVPLHSSSLDALGRYQCRRDQMCPSPHTPALFVSAAGERLRHGTVQPVFRRLLRRSGVGAGRSRRPRLHDFRHSFAVRTLLGWHQHGVDVETRLPALSTYLGHRDPAKTYWYLSATPELLAHSVARLEATFEGKR
jgi:integrase